MYRALNMSSGSSYSGNLTMSYAKEKNPQYVLYVSPYNKDFVFGYVMCHIEHVRRYATMSLSPMTFKIRNSSDSQHNGL